MLHVEYHLIAMQFPQVHKSGLDDDDDVQFGAARRCGRTNWMIKQDVFPHWIFNFKNL